MAHFAKLDGNNNVLAVHVVNNDVITVDGNESEQIGIDFLTETHGHPYWKQCSYNAVIRKHYPGVNWTYNPTLDAFIPPKPFSSWILNEENCFWEPPVANPNDGKAYKWDETTLSWYEVTSL